MTALQEAAMRKAILLCEWIAETPHQRGSINGQAAQVEYALRTALAQQGEQAKPAAYITDTWQGPMVWTPEMYNDACTYCDDGEFPVPLYTAAPAPQAHPEVDGGEFVNGVWRGVAAPQPAQGDRPIDFALAYGDIYKEQKAALKAALQSAQPVVNQQMTTVKESLTHQSAQPVAPLTDDQIKSMWAQYCGYPGGILDFARAVREVK